MLKKTAMAIALALASAAVQAAPITFTFSGAGDLILDGTPHAATAFTVTIHADTNNVHQTFAILGYASLSGALDLGALGSGTFSNPMYVFNNQPQVIAGFGDFHGDLFGIVNAGLESYDLASIFGPVTDTPYNPGQWSNVVTSLGTISFQNFTSSTFSATMGSVPEPASLLLIAIGIAALGIGHKRSANVC